MWVLYLLLGLITGVIVTNFIYWIILKNLDKKAALSNTNKINDVKNQLNE